MASNTKKSNTVRRWKRTKQGRRRKQKLQNAGSTPKFSIHRQ